MKKLKLKFVTWLLKEYEVRLNYSMLHNQIGVIENSEFGNIKADTLILDTIKIDGDIQIIIKPKQ